MFSRQAALAAALLIAGALPQPAIARGAVAESGDWRAFAAGFVEARLKAEPDFAVNVGRHEFDGRTPDWSREGLRREVLALRRAVAAARAFPEAKLSARQKQERAQLIAVASEQLFWRERAAAPTTNPQWYLVRLDPEGYTVLTDRPPLVRLEGYIRYLGNVPRLAAQARENLAGPMPEVMAQRGAAGAAAYARYYRSTGKAAFEGVGDADRQRALAEASERAALAMDELQAWFPGRGDPSVTYAVGEGGMAALLQAVVGLSASPATIEKVGRQDLEQRRSQLKAACARFAPGADIAACLVRMEALKPAKPLRPAAEDQVAALRRFLETTGIVTVPAGGPPLVMSSQPPPVERNLPEVQFLSPPNRTEAVPGRSQILFQSIHESFPGHYLRYLHARQNPSALLRLWCNYATDEGWANYSEEMMWRAGVSGRDAEGEVAQVRLAIVADVRLLTALGLHRGTMDLPQAAAMFEREALLAPDVARLQAARAAYDPGYVAYGLGALMLGKLADDWLSKHRAGRSRPSDLRAFHDRFLSYGGLPIPEIRREMLGDNDVLPQLDSRRLSQ